MKIKRIDDRSGRVTLGQFLEDAGLVLVLTETYDRVGKPIHEARIEDKMGLILNVTCGDHAGDKLMGKGVTERYAIIDLRNSLLSGYITKIGSVVVPKLKGGVNGIID